MLRLEQWHYRVVMQCGGDGWALHGFMYDHPQIPDGQQRQLSCPVEFDKERMIVKTFSGSVYQLGECGGNLAKQIKYIEEDVVRGQEELNKNK